jgi:hypothetical protein
MISRWLVAFGALLLLSACGGGGGGGGSGGAGAAVSFSPSTVTTNIAVGTSGTLFVHATVNNPSAFNGDVYVRVIDSAGILTGTVNITPTSDTTFSVVMYSSPALAKGRYRGQFQIDLCRDPSCSQRYPGSPLSLPYDVTVTAAPLSASAIDPASGTAYVGVPLAKEVAVSVAADTRTWSASTTESWLAIVNGSGTGNGSFQVRYSTAGMGAGTYAGNVVVTANDGQVSNVPFSLQVLPVQFSLTTGIPSFTAVNGSPISAQQVGFKLNSEQVVPWTATSSASWMIASPLSGTTPGAITLQPDPTIGALASGSYSSNLVLSSPGLSNFSVTSTLTLVRPTLSASSPVINIGGPKGRDLGGGIIRIALDTLGNSWPWTLSALPTTLTSSTAGGNVGPGGTTLSIEPGPSAVQGATSSVVTVTAQVNGDSVSLPITVNTNLDQRRLLVSEHAIALTSKPGLSSLSRVVKINDNFGGALNWAASSDQSWLAVTSSGSTGVGADLTLSADPASLPNNSLSYATVFVTPVTPGVEGASIRVAVWKDDAAVTVGSKVIIPADYKYVVADTLRPFVYAHNGGSGIDVYNAYTAQKLATIPVGGALSAMAVSPKGDRLYVIDHANGAIAVIDLDSMSKVATWTNAASAGNHPSTPTSILAIRPNGVEVVISDDGRVFADGRFLGATSMVGAVTSSPDGRRVYTQDTGISPGTAQAFDVDYSAMSGGVLLVSPAGIGGYGGNGKDLAVNANGSRLYSAYGGPNGPEGSPYHCLVANPSTMQQIGYLPGGAPYPNNIEVTRDQRVICGLFGWYSEFDIWLHASDGSLLAGYRAAGYAQALRDRQMVVTPDGFVVVALTDDPRIVFLAIGP